MPEPTNLSDADLYAIAEQSLPHWGLKPEAMELVSRSENTVYRLDIDGRKSRAAQSTAGLPHASELESSCSGPA